MEETKQRKKIQPVRYFASEYTPEEMKHLEDLYSQTLQTQTEGEIVSGKIVRISNKDVTVDIGLKSEGIVSIADFIDGQNLQLGDSIEVFLEQAEDVHGQVLLSKKKADVVRTWEKLYESLEKGVVLQGKIINRVKGGMTVNINGIEAFLPGSQIDVRPIRDFDALIGQKMLFKVIKINPVTQNVIISHKVLVEEEYRKRRDEILSNIKVGMILEGVVKNVTDFGIFVDLGGLDGLVHITDISWGRVNHPSEKVAIDDVIRVAVIGYDQEKQRVALGMKQLTPHPWENIETKYPIGGKVKAKILTVAEYGVFLELEKGIEGLVHISEISWAQHTKQPAEFLKTGEEVECVVLSIDKDNMKLSLSIRQSTENPWQHIDQKYTENSIHKGIVRNIAEFGAFVELEPGVDGLIHISDLSWTKKIRHPQEILKIGEEIQIKILKLDIENRKISLGYKQLHEDPWTNFDTIFAVGTETKGMVREILEKGIVVSLSHGVDGFVPRTHLLKGGVKDIHVSFKKNDELPLKVIEFDKENKRIILSALAYFKDKSKEEIEEYLKAHPKEREIIKEETKELDHPPATT